MYLALLCKASDIKGFGYAEVLKPLLDDIAILEKDGILIPVIGKTVKGTIYCVVADNLGTHSVAGLVESFSGPYICRFCLGEHADFQEKEVRSGAFNIRTKEDTIRKPCITTHLWCEKALPTVRETKPFSHG